MRVGFHLTPFWSPTDRGATRIIDEAIEVVAAASRMGYGWVSIGQHWVSHPTVWPQPFPMLARLAPETGAMRLKTSVLLLPILNAVETAENVATLDHIAHGRLDVGVAIGYREKELETAGLARKDRVPKLEESLALMKRLWTGEEVTFEGAYNRVSRARLGFTPFQEPASAPGNGGAERGGDAARGAHHRRGVFRASGRLARHRPPGRRLPGGARGERRADAGLRGRLAQPHRGLRQGGRAGRRAELPRADLLHVPDVGDAGIDHGPAPARLRYTPGRLDGERLPRDCLETLGRARDLGLDRVGFTIYSLPREVRARIEYLQMIAEEIVRPAGALA